MIIYGNGGRPFDRCDDYDPLRSSIGVGPQGDGIDVRVVEDDPYGYYRLQFLNSNTGEVLTTTPNLDPGSRFFVCTQDFWLVGPMTTFEAASTNFSTAQAITIQDARVGDLVIYHVSRPISDDDNRHHNFLGFGVITSISNNGSRITFTEMYEFDTTMSIENLSIPIDKIANNAVTTIKIANNAVTTEKIAPHTITYADISVAGINRIHQDNLDDNAVNTRVIADDSVTDAKLSNDGVKATKIPWPVNTSKFGRNGQILATHANGVVEWIDQQLPSVELMERAVTNWLDEHPEATTTVEDGAITNSKLNSSLKRSYIRVFDTVSDMQAAMDLEVGMTCRTNGFYTFGDGGAAFYVINDSEVTNGMDRLACGNLCAKLVGGDISNVRTYGAREKDSTVDWQGIIDAIAARDGNLDFDSGIWYFSEGVTVPISVRKMCGNATIVVTEQTDVLFTIMHGGSDRDFFRVQGLNFYGWDSYLNTCLVNTFLLTEATNVMHVYSCNFANYLKVAIVANLGIVVEGCTFSNEHVRNQGCAISTTSDGQITNCKVFFNKYGIAASSARISDSYIFGQPTGEDPIYGIVHPNFVDNETNTSTIGAAITNCEFDCVSRCFANPRSVLVQSSVFYWNGADDTLNDFTRSIFYSTYQYFDSIIFINNSINMNTTNLISGKAVTFDSMNANAQIINYVSYGCRSPLFLQGSTPSEEVLRRCNFMVGLIPTYSGFSAYNTDGASGANPYMATHFTQQDGNTANAPCAFDIKTSQLNGILKFFKNSVSYILLNKSVHSAAVEKVAYLPDTSLSNAPVTDMYITVIPRAIEHIAISRCRLMNMSWVPITTGIDLTGYTARIATSVQSA